MGLSPRALSLGRLSVLRPRENHLQQRPALGVQKCKSSGPSGQDPASALELSGFRGTAACLTGWACLGLRFRLPSGPVAAAS